MKRKTLATILLSLLSPFFAEVLSGSTPPLEFINPLSFIFLWAFYGAGVLLAREAWVRWGRNYLRLMMLGFVYGIFEEGIVIKSWFNPAWPDLDAFAHYGRVWGINGAWAIWLTIFHSLMSITAPIMVLDAIFPDLKDKPLLGRRGISLLFVSISTASIFLYFFLVPYNPPPVQYFLAIISLLIFLFLARKIKIKSFFKKSLAHKHPAVYGAGIGASLFLIFTAFPHSSIHPLVPAILGILLVLHFYSHPAYLTERGKYDLILGFLFFWFVPYDIVLEINGIRGEAILGPLTFTLLLLQRKKLGYQAR